MPNTLEAMEVLTKPQIARTILNLYHSGKRMPDVLLDKKSDATPAQQTLQTVVDIWFSLYGSKYSPERWDEAERIALTTPCPAGVPANVIAPQLMGWALKQAETEHLEQQRVSSPKDVAEPSYGSTKKAQMLLRWTIAKQSEQREIMPFMPTDEECVECGRRLGLSDKAFGEQRMLIRIFLNDQNYANSVGMKMKYKLVTKDEQIQFVRLT